MKATDSTKYTIRVPKGTLSGFVFVPEMNRLSDVTMLVPGDVLTNATT